MEGVGLVVIDGNFLIGLGTLITAVVAAYMTVRVKPAVDQVNKKLRTTNTLEVGEIVDALMTESVDKIPSTQRTPTQAAHAASVAAQEARDASARANVVEARSKGNGVKIPKAVPPPSPPSGGSK